MSETATETTAPPENTYSVGSVNTDSLKEILTFLAQNFPFVDEAAKSQFVNQVNSLDKAGDPNAPVETTAASDSKDAQIAALEAQIADMKAAQTQG